MLIIVMIMNQNNQMNIAHQVRHIYIYLIFNNYSTTFSIDGISKRPVASFNNLRDFKDDQDPRNNVNGRRLQSRSQQGVR